MDRTGTTLGVPVLLLVVTLLLRGWSLGNPNIHVDEQFYALVGQRMLGGDLPYVDIFDVKPFGLFLIYAGAAAISGTAVWAYQLATALAAFATALTIVQISRIFASATASAAVAVAYIAWLSVFEGVGGQSPVFYNLPMSLAALTMLRIVRAAPEVPIFRRGIATMGFTGIAILIKDSVVFEGVFFGLSLLLVLWRRGRSFQKIIASAFAFVGVALLPNAISLAYFAWRGALEPYWQANFISIFYRDASFAQFLTSVARLLQQQIALLPFWVACVIVFRRRRSLMAAQPEPVLFLWGWAAAAMSGYLLYGTWSEHFVLPLLPPLSIIAAQAIDQFASPKAAGIRLIAIGVIGGLGRVIVAEGTDGGPRDLYRVASLVSPYLNGGCLYVANAPSSLYSLTGACLPSRYVFPSHLLSQRYAATLGADSHEEMRALIARKPSVVVKGKTYTNANAANEAALMAALHADYDFKAHMRIGVRWVDVWVIKKNQTLEKPHLKRT